MTFFSQAAEYRVWEKNQLVKKVFLTSWWTGGASSPARCRGSNFQFEPRQFRPQGETAESCGFCASCHPYHNLLEFSLENSGRKLCKVDIFLPGNEISLQKNIANPPRLSPDLILRGSIIKVGVRNKKDGQSKPNQVKWKCKNPQPEEGILCPRKIIAQNS